MAAPKTKLSCEPQTQVSNPFSFASFVGQKLTESKGEDDIFDEMLGASFRSSARPTSRNSLIVVDDSEDLLSSDGMKRPKSLDAITYSKGHDLDNRRLSFQTMLPLDDVKGYIIDGDSEDEDFLEAPRQVLAAEHEAKGDVLINALPRYKGRLLELEEENEKLKEEISEVTRLNDHNLARLECLEQQLREQEKKEQEETAALEKMVRGVERNLQMAMERAASAEALSTSLKHELKALQASYKEIEHERDTLKENSVSTTATDVASKLRLAADSAEAQLKLLMEGVSHLRLYSDVLSSISRVQEEPS